MTRETVAALLTRRRLFAVIVVCVPLIWVQARLSQDPLAGPQGALMCLAFVLVGPTAWRLLAPSRTRGVDAALRVLAYGLVGAVVVATVGIVVPRSLRMGPTFLTAPDSLFVALALFWVGGWGLARDVEFELDLQAAHARTRALEREAERAQLLALRRHLDPHFLFNTLNAIAEWCREDGEVAERAVLDLSSMLRTILAGVQLDHWSLSREIELVEALFELHRVRDPVRLRFSVHVAPGLLGEREVPPMLLLPLAENAVKHGPASGHQGEVELRAVAEEGDLVLRLSNPGPYAGPRDGGEGLPMVRRRLELAYDGAAGFEVRDVGGSTQAEVRIPLKLRRPEVGT